MINQYKIHLWGNYLGLTTICIVLITAFYQQLTFHELPCPLCLTQRLCIIGMGLCICLNLSLGIKTSHYGLMILAAIVGFSAALKQIMIHALPGDTGYGSPFLGIYFYTWAAIIFAIAISCIAFALLFEQGINSDHLSSTKRWPKLLMVFFLLLILCNVVSTFFECGFAVCNSNPVRYQLFDTMG